MSQCLRSLGQVPHTRLTIVFSHSGSKFIVNFPTEVFSMVTSVTLFHHLLLGPQLLEVHTKSSFSNVYTSQENNLRKHFSSFELILVLIKTLTRNLNCQYLSDTLPSVTNKISFFFFSHLLIKFFKPLILFLTTPSKNVSSFRVFSRNLYLL